MIFNLVIISCTVAAALAQYHQQPSNEISAIPAQYPAGLDPKSCPNYPDCSNPLVTVQAILRPHQPPPPPQQSGQPQNQYPPEIQQKLDRGEYIGDGDYHGEGLAEALAPQALAPTHQYAPQSQAAAPQYYQPQQQYQIQPQSAAARAYNPAQAQTAQYTPQYASNPQYITAPRYTPASQYSQARLFNPGANSPQYTNRAAPVHEARSYNPVASGSEPAQSVQIPAGLDPRACPNYPYCHS